MADLSRRKSGACRHQRRARARGRTLALLGWLVLLDPSRSLAQANPPSQPASASREWSVRALPLPQGEGPASFDYIAFDPHKQRVLIPNARDVGSLDVFDPIAQRFTRVAGFAVSSQTRDGKPHRSGPSAISVGAATWYVGDRASQEVCIVGDDLTRGACTKLSTAIDGVVYIAPTQEVWVTAPSARRLIVLDASDPKKLTPKSQIDVAGEPEGYAVDPIRNLFYTNREDTDETVQIDLHTHRISAIWRPQCGSEGPRGIALDVAAAFVFVACTDHVAVLDAAHGGNVIARFDTGAGVDNLDYSATRHQLYVAAAKVGRLWVLGVDRRGQLSRVAAVPTADRARNAVVDDDGRAYLIDPATPRLLIVSPPDDPAMHGR